LKQTDRVSLFIHS